MCLSLTCLTTFKKTEFFFLRNEQIIIAVGTSYMPDLTVTEDNKNPVHK